MMNAVQPKSPDAVMQALQQHGAAVGGKKMMLWEFRHAKEAVSINQPSSSSSSLSSP